MPATLEGQLTLEKTPSYFVTREAPRRVHALRPEGTLRLLVVVRDPVTRALSDYAQAASKAKRGMRSFEELAFVNGTGLVDTTWPPVKIGNFIFHVQLIS